MAKDELPRGQLSNIILSILTNTDMYGYEIIETIKEKTNGSLIIKQPSLYSCLRRMQEQNLISSYWRDSDIGGRRHYYSITDYGKKYAEKWQADLSIYNVTNNSNLEHENKSTNDIILQQTNLFAVNSNTNINIEKEESTENKSFVQYDLFTSPTLISEPSDEVFDCIKKLRATADDENTISTINTDDKITGLHNEQYTSEIKTSFIADNHNIQDKNISENEIKKAFFELSKKQKSFANVLKENPEVVLSNQDDILNKNNDFMVDNFNQDVHLPNKEIYNITPSVNNDNKENSTNVYNKNTEEGSTKNMPDIYQSTTEFKDFDINQQEPSTFEFIDLNNLDFDVKESKTESFNDNSFSNQVIQDTSVVENLNVAVDNNVINEVKSNNEEKVVMQTKDDAVYITESYAEVPKVKKIAPARFEQFTKYDSRIDEKVYEIYNKQYPQKSESTCQAEGQSKIEDSEQSQQSNYIPSNDFESLKHYYKNLNINFNTYKKEQNTSQINYINKNKINMFTYISISIFSIILSVIMFCLLKDVQIAWNWLYIVLPVCIVLGNSYFIIKYITNKSCIASINTYYNYNWIYRLILSIAGILMIFAINLLCGMNLENISEFLTTFVYLSVMICLIPLTSLLNLIFIKTKIAKV